MHRMHSGQPGGATAAPHSRCGAARRQLTKAWRHAQVVLVTLPGTDVQGILDEVQRQTEQLPRGSTVQAALVNSSVVQAASREEAAFISNRFSCLQLPATHRALASAVCVLACTCLLSMLMHPALGAMPGSLLPCATSMTE